MPDHLRSDEDRHPFRELLAMSLVAVGLVATVVWMLFLVSGFRWLGAFGSKWATELLLSLRAGLPS
jgi:hypothetical protein